MTLKMLRTAIGIKPGSMWLPRIVCVLPLDVWPYAKIVPLMPSMAEHTMR